MPSTPSGIVYPDSSGHTRLWEHFQDTAESADEAIDNAASSRLGIYAGVQMYNAANSTCPNNAWTRVRYTTTRKALADVAHNSASGSGVFTVSKAGWYEVRTAHTFGTNSTGSRGALIRDGAGTVWAQDSRTGPNANGGPAVAIAILQLAVGDTFTVEIFQNSGGTLDVVSSAAGYCSTAVKFLGA